ncbi:MAG: hypothetical protein GXO28_04560 [Methanopyri archaeon]|nr:hypothetical protein [Methanopyri archaeon]
MRLECPSCGGLVRPFYREDEWGLKCEECDWRKNLPSRPSESTRLEWFKAYAREFLRREFDDCGVVKVVVRGPRGPRGSEYVAATVYASDHHSAIGPDGERVRGVEEELNELASELRVPPVRITVQPAHLAD